MGILSAIFGSDQDEGDATQRLMDEAYDAEQDEMDGAPLREDLHFVTDANGNPVRWAPGLHPDPDRVFNRDGLVYDGREDNPGAYEQTVHIETDDRPWWKLW